MYSMVLLAALTTAVDMPDRGRRGGGCCGCYGGMAWGGGGWGGCYGMGMGMGMGGWGGGCYGMGMGGWGGGGYGMGMGGGWGGRYGMGMGGWGYGGYVLGNAYPMIGAYSYTPTIANYGTAFAGINGAILNPGLTQSFYANPALTNAANEATIVVHLPQNANLTIDGQPTQSRSATRIFRSPPLERGKTYTYSLNAEMNRDGQFINAKKTIEVRAGEQSEVTLNLNNANQAEEQTSRQSAPENDAANQVAPAGQRRTPAVAPVPGEPSSPTPPRDR